MTKKSWCGRPRAPARRAPPVPAPARRTPILIPRQQRYSRHRRPANQTCRGPRSAIPARAVPAAVPPAAGHAHWLFYSRQSRADCSRWQVQQWSGMQDRRETRPRSQGTGTRSSARQDPRSVRHGPYCAPTESGARLADQERQQTRRTVTFRDRLWPSLRAVPDGASGFQ